MSSKSLKINNIKVIKTSSKVKSIDFHPNESIIVTGQFDGQVNIFNYNDQIKLVQSVIVSPGHPVRTCKFIPSKDWIVTGSDDGVIRVYNYKSMELVKSITTQHTDFIRCIQVHPTKSLILSCSDDKSIKLFDWEQDWICIREFSGYHNRYVMNLSFINTLDQFASVSLDSTIAIWDINNSSPIQTFKDDSHKSLNTVSFLNDNQYLITGSDDKNLKIWDLKSQSVINELVGHEYNVTSILYNPELQLTISSSEDGSVKFWNSDNTLVHTLIDDFQSQGAVWPLAQKNVNNISIIAIGYNDDSSINTGDQNPGRVQLRSLFHSYSKEGIHFNSNRQLKMEICSGHGHWITEKAAQESIDTDWISVEIRYDRIFQIWSKMVLESIDNLSIIGGEAYSSIKNTIPNDILDEVYINYPN
eukprot:gene4909-6120_t